MNTIIDAAFKLLDALIEQTKSLSPEEARVARSRLFHGIVERSSRIAEDEAADLAAIPTKPTHSPSGGTSTSGMG